MRPIQRLLVTAPLRKAEALGLLVGGLAFYGWVITSTAPSWAPAWLPVVAATIGILASLRGVFGLLPHRLFQGLYVDASSYAQALADESLRLDVAHLPPLRATLDGPAEIATDYERLRGRSVLAGGHGSGKSRFSIDLAANWLRAGRRGLHIRLSAWNGDLSRLLAESLSVAAGQVLDAVALDAYLSGDGFLVMDSIDEVPYGDRESVGGQIQEFAAAHPNVDVIVTARTASLPEALGSWKKFGLAPLTDDQVTSVLGEPRHARHLPDAIEDLATNPLMLGLLNAQIKAGGSPQREDDLLDSFIDQVVRRQSSRDRGVDTQSGWRLAEEVAWVWLGTGQVALDDNKLRTTCASVSVALQAGGFLHSDAQQIERWFVEAGLAARVRGQVLPSHRSILDHLASRGIMRHRNDPEIGRDPYREAVARYVGRADTVDAVVTGLLLGRTGDLEFLARCARLVRDEIVWNASPENFATQYLDQLRGLAGGPLKGLGVIPTAVHLQIARDLSWAYQEAGPDVKDDTVQVVDSPPRMYIKVGGEDVAVSSFRTAGHLGRDISIRVPQLAAFESAKDELLDRLNRHLLPDESAEMTYERLCKYSKRLGEVLSAHGRHALPGFARELQHVSADELLERVIAWLGSLARRKVSVKELATTLVAWSPNPDAHGILFDAVPTEDDPYDPSQNRSEVVIHGAPLLYLTARARNLGIANLPLHPLGLLPESAIDPILALPDHLFRPTREQATLYIARHELAEIRSIRYVVERSFSGLASRIRSYSTLPWRIKIVLNEGDSTLSGGWSIKGQREVRVDQDEVLFVEKLNGDWAWSFASGLSSYRGVVQGVYQTLSRDVGDLLGGEGALGKHELS